MTAPDPYRLPDPYLPAGAEGPLVLPPAVARLTWPAVKAYLEDLRDRGALETVRAAGPALNRWESVFLAGSGFRSETAASDGDSGGRPSQHDEWISTDDAADRLGCSAQWVNTRWLGVTTSPPSWSAASVSSPPAPSRNTGNAAPRTRP